jgi:5-methyltetrahydrofolate--homocysteine methyltransferase
VDIILTNNGYDVVNLGIKVGIAEMLQAAEEHKADAIGMSGLLVKSTLIMRENLEELNGRGLAHIPSSWVEPRSPGTYVERDLRQVYEGRVFYGRDAFEGLNTMDRLVELLRSGEDDPTFGRELTGRKLPPRKSQLDALVVADRPPRSPEAVMDNPVFTPPFLGSRVAKGIALDDIAGYLNLTALFRNQWGYRPKKGEDDSAFKDRVSAVLREELDIVKAQDLLIPQVVWGYFAANAEGDDVVLWSDETRRTELQRFSFPRQNKEPWLCIADFYRPVESGELDYAAFQLVTMGSAVSEAAATLFAEDRYSDYLRLHGSAWRWPKHWPSTGTGVSAKSGDSPTRTGPISSGSSASSTGAVATPGATRPAPIWRTTPRWSISSGVIASGWW